jgi:NAD(P)-dependent dehydrogenase (short-subunit alcohol dehydrogenase family)
MLLQDTVAVITGVGAGLGRAAAQLFGEHGARLLVSDVAPDRVESAVADLQAAGVDAIGQPADVSIEAEVVALVERATSHFGRLNIMYNNAGFDLLGGWAVTFEDTTDEARQRILGVNLSGVFYGIKYAARAMKESGGGSIITTSSAAALRAVPDHGIYAAAKSGVSGLVRNCAVDLGRYGIRVNAVAPASIVPTN